MYALARFSCWRALTLALTHLFHEIRQDRDALFDQNVKAFAIIFFLKGIQQQILSKPLWLSSCFH